MPSVFRGKQFERELKTIANTNPQFRNGDADKVSFSTKVDFHEGNDLEPFMNLENDELAEFLINALDCTGELLYEFSAERIRNKMGRFYVYLLGITYEQVVNGLPAGILSKLSPEKQKKLKKQKFADLTLLTNTTFIITTNPEQPSTYIETVAYKRKNKTLYAADTDDFTMRGAEGIYIHVDESEQDSGTYVFVPDEGPYARFAFPESVELSLQIHDHETTFPFQDDQHIAARVKLALQAMKSAGSIF